MTVTSLTGCGSVGVSGNDAESSWGGSEADGAGDAADEESSVEPAEVDADG